ncbi:G1 family glutamic endopeptidase [Kitasatospora aureofaciens]|uniref:G1 family glutamic endopeptidase n=1 Tax=Kitasatospora aureofaciens TaxID=1894 RepID=UPI00052538EA|nr:G1 family glutamic endopeptidase [Kitasatospora aureofaciens]
MPKVRRHALVAAVSLLALLGSAPPALPAALPVAAPVLAPITAHHHGNGVLHGTSSNWSGYAATGGKFTSVKASWVQPAVSCTSADAWSAFWVGLDGDGSKTVEQIGTEADCSSGSPVYSSWYEMYPSYPVNLRNSVQPGDHFTASVTTDGAGSFTLTLTNATAGWTRSVNKTLQDATLASAEVIAEAPSSLFSVLPLADFGTVDFTGADVNGQNLGASNASSIDMVEGGVTRTTTSELGNGTDFSVTWHHS